MKKTVLILVLLLLGTLCGYPQRADILTMQREGTAGIYTSESDKIACIIDGGHKGGLTTPRLNGKPVLEALLSQGYKELVISCSHPHADHAAGLKEIVQSGDITRFSKIKFIDSGYPEAESLFQLFREHHPAYPANQVSHASANGKNGFAGVFRETSGLQIETFVYTPKEGASKHGHSSIHHVTIQQNGQRQFLVDFDDADDSLIKLWSEWAKQDPLSRRPDIAIAPHHNADTVNIQPLLDEEIRPRKCVITANPRNKFLHPGPINTVKWIEHLGSESIFITGAHENIVIDEKGVSSVVTPETKKRAVDSILAPMRSSLEKQITEMEEGALEFGLTPSQRNRLQTLQHKSRAVERLLAIYKDMPKSTQSTAASASPMPGLVEASHPIPNKSLTGDFEHLRDTFEQDFRQTRTSAVQPTSPGSLRVTKFGKSLKMFPTRGGIILGNMVSAASGKVTKAVFIVNTNGCAIRIEAQQDGATIVGTFEEMTESELWAAYNFVKPDRTLIDKFGLDETENGLVGISGHMEATNGWKFGIHPAVAGTLVARDAMRLDMSIAVGGETLVRLDLPEFHSYQWYDDVALIRIEDGRITVRSETNSNDGLLRIRFWTNALPPWVESEQTFLFDRKSEMEKRAKRMNSSYPHLATNEKRNLERALYTLLDREIQTCGGNVKYEDGKLIDWMDHHFDAYRRINRFARTVAVLHWISDTSATGLPPLPKNIQMKRFAIPAQLEYKDVKLPGPELLP